MNLAVMSRNKTMKYGNVFRFEALELTTFPFEQLTKGSVTQPVVIVKTADLKSFPML